MFNSRRIGQYSPKRFGGQIIGRSEELESGFVSGGYGMNDRNETMIDAVIKKAEALCPDSLALIGI